MFNPTHTTKNIYANANWLVQNWMASILSSNSSSQLMIRYSATTDCTLAASNADGPSLPVSISLLLSRLGAHTMARFLACMLVTWCKFAMMRRWFIMCFSVLEKLSLLKMNNLHVYGYQKNIIKRNTHKIYIYFRSHYSFKKTIIILLYFYHQ